MLHTVVDTSPKRTRRAARMTLVELLLVVAILCLLATLLQPCLVSAIERARRIECANRQRQTYTGLAVYSNDSCGWNPSGMEYGTFRDSWYPTYGSLGNFRIEHLNAATVIDGSNYPSMRKGKDLGVSVGKDCLMFCPTVDTRRTDGAWRWRFYHADSLLGYGPWVELPSSTWQTFLYDSFTQMLVGAGIFGYDGVGNDQLYRKYGSTRLDRMSPLNGRLPAIITESFTSSVSAAAPHRGEGMNVTDHTGAIRWVSKDALVYGYNCWVPSRDYLVPDQHPYNPLSFGAYGADTPEAARLRAALGYR